MFSGVLRFILCERSIIIVSMVVKLVSSLFCFSLFHIVSVLVLFICVRMLMVLFNLFSFDFCFICLFSGCGVVWTFYVFVALNFVGFIIVLSFDTLDSSCFCEHCPLL